MKKGEKLKDKFADQVNKKIGYFGSKNKLIGNKSTSHKKITQNKICSQNTYY
jgi:hypothetical protein